VFVLAALAIALVAWRAWPFLYAGAMLLDVAGHTGGVRVIVPVRPHDVHHEDLVLPTRDGTVVARWYRPTPSSDRTVVVFPGIHGGGLDEPRLALFSQRLAGTGVNVVAVPLPELRAFRITARSTDTIEDAVTAVTRTPRLAPDARVGIIGVSFAGGLAIVAAGRPALSGVVQFVVSLGGHGDLGRVLRYLCTGALPDGAPRSPHDYGVAVLTLAAVPLITPPDQAVALEQGVLQYLEASLDGDPEQPRARPVLERLARVAETMPAPSSTLLRAVLARDVGPIGRTILPYVDRLAADPSLSPERSPLPDAPVFLIHGDEDNVIPSSETPHLAEHFRRAGKAQVRWTLTPLLSHLALTGGASWVDRWALVSMWKDIEAASRGN
jgi:pimeloyl-ACP methyl ester carboxylesterase